MLLKIYAIYDKAAETFGTPVFLKADGIAMRMIKDEVDNPESPIGKHPEDFQLFYLGRYLQDLGTFDFDLDDHGLQFQPKLIAEAQQFKE